MRYRPLKSSIKNNVLEIETETGHIVEFEFTPIAYVDIDNKTDDDKPFFYVTFNQKYLKVRDNASPMNLKDIKTKYENTTIIPEGVDFEYVDIGFVYDETSPHYNSWMINFFTKEHTLSFNLSSSNLKLDCPFTTRSWNDGTWHGRFVIAHSDLIEVLEPKQSKFIIKGKGDIGKYKLEKLDKDIEAISIKYNIHTNTWSCNLLKNNKIAKSYPCNNLTSDVPTIGKIDSSTPKYNVTFMMKAQDIKGLYTSSDNFIIKGV